MRVKSPAALFYALIFIAVFPGQSYAQNDLSSFSPGELVFIGVSGRLSSKNDSLEAALRDAARRFSFFHSVSGQSLTKEHIGTGIFDYSNDEERGLSYDENLEKYLDELRFDPARDIFENNNAVFVITRASAGRVMPSSAGHSVGRARPVWTDLPPEEINGFIAGVGFADRRSSHKDTVIASYENAVFAIIANISTTINGKRQIYENSYSAFGFDMSTDNTALSQASLKNFYILESWTDPVNLSVWTLAVAEKDEDL